MEVAVFPKPVRLLPSDPVSNDMVPVRQVLFTPVRVLSNPLPIIRSFLVRVIAWYVANDGYTTSVSPGEAALWAARSEE